MPQDAAKNPSGIIYFGIVVIVFLTFASNIRSLTSSTVRRAEAMVGIGYKDDIEQAIAAIKNEIGVTMPFVLMVPEPEFRVEELGDSSINIRILAWHPGDDWSQAQAILLTTVRRALAKAGIDIPFPQRVIWEAKE